MPHFYLIRNLSQRSRLILSLLLPLLRKIRLSNGSFPPQSLPHRASRRSSGKQTKSRNILWEVEFSWLHHHCRHRATPCRGHVMTSVVQRPCVIIIPGNWVIPPSYVHKRSNLHIWAGSLLTSCKTLLVQGQRNCNYWNYFQKLGYSFFLRLTLSAQTYTKLSRFPADQLLQDLACARREEELQ